MYNWLKELWKNAGFYLFIYKEKIKKKEIEEDTKK